MTIKNGKYQGDWALMHKTGFGIDGNSSQFRMIGKSGKLLINKTLNLTFLQIEKIKTL